MLDICCFADDAAAADALPLTPAAMMPLMPAAPYSAMLRNMRYDSVYAYRATMSFRKDLDHGTHASACHRRYAPLLSAMFMMRVTILRALRGRHYRINVRYRIMMSEQARFVAV